MIYLGYSRIGQHFNAHELYFEVGYGFQEDLPPQSLTVLTCFQELLTCQLLENL